MADTVLWKAFREELMDIIADPFEAAQASVQTRIEQVLDAATAKDFDRLASYHLAGPKFTKFDDVEPLDRQDAETGMRLEVEQFTGMEDFHGRFDDLKIDVFGPVAIAWRLSGDTLDVNLTVPVGSTAVLDLPLTAGCRVDGADGDTLGPGTHHLTVYHPRVATP